MTLTTIITLIIIGLMAGILSGLVGVGGGIIMVPLFVFFLGLIQNIKIKHRAKKQLGR